MIIDSTIGAITKKIQTGKTPPTSNEEYFNGEYNWYTPSDLNKKFLGTSIRTITNKSYEDRKAIAYPKNTILLSCIGDIGKIGITIDEASSSNQQITGLILDEDKIIPEYFYYWCISHKYIFEKSATNAIVPILNNKRLKNIRVWFDEDKKNQKKIANLLSQIENLIQKRERSIELLDKLVKSTFLDMFGDPSLNKKDWDLVPLSQMGEIDRGVSKHRPRNAPELLGGDYPLIQTGDISNTGLYLEEYNSTYSELGLAQSKLWEKDTLCITIAANIAKTAILKFDACFPDSIVGMKVNNENTNNIFMYYIFDSLQKILEKNAPAAAQKNINLGILRKLRIPKPPKDLQDKFEKIVIKIENTKKIYQNSLDELNQLFGSVSQKAFKGELELRHIKLEEIIKARPELMQNSPYFDSSEIASFYTKDSLDTTKEEKILQSNSTHARSKYKEKSEHLLTIENNEYFKKIIKELLEKERSFIELYELFSNKYGFDIPYDKKRNKEKKKHSSFKESIFELLKTGKIVQQIREYKEDGELKRQIVLKAKK